ncbi:MAG: carbohydrate binding family 9 domain-containing protein [Acidobacteria bacterium]|nr:carbohydrate binding family 9 domain-containing protein [Acidobacteriota bacterium]MBI3423512.1 carbohydrate binding family 9 domain-containing protein [Acidobacteriota bacterium]
MKFQRCRYLCVLCCAVLSSLTLAQALGESGVANNAAPGKAKTTKIAPVLPPEKAQPVHLTRFATEPTIDGKLNDEVWATAAVFKDFLQTRPGENVAPSLQTEVRMGYDARNLYFAFRAWDEAGKVRATVAKRDNLWDDDFIWLALDTFNDRRKAYIMAFNPLGVQADGIFTEGGNINNEDYSVDIVMESKGQVVDDGYIIEVKVPFKSLRYEIGKGKAWGLHLQRTIKHKNNEQTSWMPLARNINGFLTQEGHITGIENISTERNLEIIPSLTLSESGRRVPALPVGLPVGIPALNDPGRFVNQPLNFDPGLSLKYGITPNITLDFTINPDFAQVEADQTVLTANQRFPLFFEERRPFFLEGIEIFQTALQPVHTRTIVDPDYAAKISGKRGRNTFGLMLAADRAPGNYSEDERNDPGLRADIARFLDHRAYIGVARAKHDVGRESEIGLIATSYNFIEKHNHVGGIDGRFKINPQSVFSFQVLATNSRRYFYSPDEDKNTFRTGNGFGYTATFDYTQRRYGFFATSEGRTRDYRADVGFTRRTNSNFSGLFGRLSSDPKRSQKAMLQTWRIFSRVISNYDFQGRSQQLTAGANLFMQFQKQIAVGFGGNRGYERIFEEEFGPKRASTRAGAFAGGPERSAAGNNVFVFANARPSKKYTAGVETGLSTAELDYDFGAGPRFPRISPAALANPNAALDPGAGRGVFLNANVSYQPTNPLRFSLNYTNSRLTRHDTGRLAYKDHIYSFRTTYQFTRFVFVRSRVDYSTLAARVRGQFLFGYTPNPGTSFYVGYNDDMNYRGFSPFTARYEPGFERNGRTFFIKMSYLIRKSIK